MFISLLLKIQIMIILISFISCDLVNPLVSEIFSSPKACNKDDYIGFLVIFNENYPNHTVEETIGKMLLNGSMIELNTTYNHDYQYALNITCPFIYRRFNGPLYGFAVNVPATKDIIEFKNCFNLSAYKDINLPYFLSFLSPLIPYISYYEKSSLVFPAVYNIDELDGEKIPPSESKECRENSKTVTIAGYRPGEYRKFTLIDKVEFHPQAESQSLKSWHLLRICYRERLDYSKPYLRRSNLGKGVDCYVLDSGIDINHPEFGGRAKMLKDFSKSGFFGDGIGHGTHVAGIIAGATVGIAREANVYGVKVFETDGSSEWPTIVDALNWCHETIMKTNRRAIVNLSIQGDFSQAVNDVIYRLYKDNIPVVVAAGNQGGDACNYSPGSSKYAICVGATDQDDRLVSEPLSNHGRCVTILAPGRKIYSSFVSNGRCIYAKMSGSSMAAPIISAIIAIDLSENPSLTVDQIIHNIINRSTKNMIKNLLGDTLNRLAYSLTDFDYSI